MHQFRDDPLSTQLLATARLAAYAAHEVAGLPLVTSLAYLKLLSNNPLLPEELREKARQAALRVAEAALHLECLPEVFDTQ